MAPAKQAIKPLPKLSVVGKHSSLLTTDTPTLGEQDLPMVLGLLEKSSAQIQNRRISDQHVQEYKNAMLRNAWDINGEGIILTDDGLLVDGQHRLWAFVEAIGENPQLKVPFLFVHGVKKEAIATINQGYRRTTTHAAQISGRATNSQEMGITTYLHFTLGMDHRNLNKLDTGFILETLDKYHPSITFAAKKYNGSFSISHRSLRSIVARAHILGFDPERLSQFLKVVDTGFYNNDNDISAVLLRNFVLANRNRNKFGTSNVYYAKALWALDKFLKEEPCSNLGSKKQQVFMVVGLPN